MKGLGRQRELQVVHHFQSEGWVAYRLHEGSADVAAFQRGFVPLLIQVKGNAGSPYAHFPPFDRARLLDDAHQAGAHPVLAHWPPRGKLTLYRPSEWPQHRRKAVAA